MANKEKDIEKTAKSAYTLDYLQQNITAQFEREVQRDGEESMRDRLFHLRVLTHMLDMLATAGEDTEEEMAKRIRLKMEQDDAHFGYTCFLASNSQFGHSWSYLRSQWNKYIKALEGLCVFIHQMLNDIKFLQTKGVDVIGKKVMFANVFVASFEHGEPKVEVVWEHIGNLFNVKDGYSVTIQLENIVLLSSFCKYQENDFCKLWEKYLMITIQHEKKHA